MMHRGGLESNNTPWNKVQAAVLRVKDAAVHQTNKLKPHTPRFPTFTTPTFGKKRVSNAASSPTSETTTTTTTTSISTSPTSSITESPPSPSGQRPFKFTRESTILNLASILNRIPDSDDDRMKPNQPTPAPPVSNSTLSAPKEIDDDFVEEEAASARTLLSLRNAFASVGGYHPRSNNNSSNHNHHHNSSNSYKKTKTFSSHSSPSHPRTSPSPSKQTTLSVPPRKSTTTTTTTTTTATDQDYGLTMSPSSMRIRRPAAVVVKGSNKGALGRWLDATGANKSCTVVLDANDQDGDNSAVQSTSSLSTKVTGIKVKTTTTTTKTKTAGGGAGDDDLFKNCFDYNTCDVFEESGFDDRLGDVAAVFDSSDADPAEDDNDGEDDREEVELGPMDLLNELSGHQVKKPLRGILRTKSKSRLSMTSSSSSSSHSKRKKRKSRKRIRFQVALRKEDLRKTAAPCGYMLDPYVKSQLWYTKQERAARRKEDRQISAEDASVKSFLLHSELLYEQAATTTTTDLDIDSSLSDSKDLFQQCWLERQSDALDVANLTIGVQLGHRGLECANPIIAKHRRDRVREHVAAVVATSQCSLDGKPVSSARLRQESEELSSHCKAVALRWGQLDAIAAASEHRGTKLEGQARTSLRCLMDVESTQPEETIMLEV